MTLPLILVTGATGTVGTEMIRHLVKAGHRVRGLVRDRAKATKLGPKVELVVGDLDDPASLKPTFASVDEAFVVVNGKDLNRLEANAFDAAKSAGVSHIVKLSGRGVDWPSMHDTVLVPWHGESERRLKALGPSWTIPRPGFFASKLRSTIGCAAPTCGECRRPTNESRRTQCVCDCADACLHLSHRCACRKSNPDILVMQSTQDRTAKNVSSSLNGARYWCILVQR